MEKKIEKSNCRKFVRKLLSLIAGAWIGGLVLGRDETILKPVFGSPGANTFPVRRRASLGGDAVKGQGSWHRMLFGATGT